MPWDAQERTRYEDEVLVAARAHGLPADLFTRYGIDAHGERRLRADPSAFTEHVDRVCAYWRELQVHRRSLRKVLVDLVADHERLREEGALTHAHFHQVREETARRALSAWSEIARNLTTSLVDRDTLGAMIAPVGVSESDAERVLLDHGVRIVERLPELPDAPPADTLRALRENLRVRGVPFSPMEVFGERRLAQGFTVLDGFRLGDGSVLDETALKEAVQRLQTESAAEEESTEGAAAAENVLEILRADGDQDAREALVLWEIISDLRERPESLAEAGLVRHWIRRGLAEEEALLLAAAVRRSGARVEAASRAERDVRDLLVDNRLRQAQEAASELPEDHDLHARLRVRMKQVEELTAEAERALLAGDREEAARALAAAADVAADDEALTARLGEVEPLPPREVEARVEGRSVVVSWRPSSSLAGTVTYRVTRRTGRDGSTREVLVGELAENEITDTGAPVGAEARYTVVAVRDGQGLSEEVSTPPVMIAPEVSSLRVRAQENSVVGSWQAPAEAVRVEVLRGQGAPPRGAGDGVRIDTDGTGFRDTDVQTDVEYHYRVRAVYVTSNGHARGSAGLVRRASPGPCPDAVRDLSVLPDEGTNFRASWTPPPRGRVVLRVGAEPPEWLPGTVLGPDDLDSYGSEAVQHPVSDEERGALVGGAAGSEKVGEPARGAGSGGAGAGEAPVRGARSGHGGAASPSRPADAPPAGDRADWPQVKLPTPAAGEEKEGVRVLGTPGEPAAPSQRPARAGDPLPEEEVEGVRVLGPVGTGGDGDAAPRAVDPGAAADAPVPEEAAQGPLGGATHEVRPAPAGEPLPDEEVEGVRVLGPAETSTRGERVGKHRANTPGARPAEPAPGGQRGGARDPDRTERPRAGVPEQARWTPGAQEPGSVSHRSRSREQVTVPARAEATAAPVSEAAAEHTANGQARADTDAVEHAPRPRRPDHTAEETAPPRTDTARQEAERAQEPERALVALTLASGTNHVVAVTVAGDQAVVGSCARVTAAPPVEGLRAERFDTSVRLGWTWPEDACAAIVSWRPEERGTETWTGGELRCTRRQYASDGGFETLMGPESVRVEVRTVVSHEEGEALSSPATVTVPGRAVLDYRVEAAGLLRRDRVVHLVAEEDCTMPEVVVVYSDGPVQPHTPDEGIVLAVLPEQYLSAGEWISVRVRPPRGTGQGWLMCFPADDDGHGIRLRQPPVKELRC